ncbi:hypothetical protein Pmani_015278 [Petrolisthes manimaculis]|uniref:Uncharacterized protein n=1 Tax=Petrolisthes manimaculis TaxID=1843537 RepID=A0AAE1UA24_9EUCA|nr:hypothetical protein Pmani_015278 [Petrolisthes manimaculis]
MKSRGMTSEDRGLRHEEVNVTSGTGLSQDTSPSKALQPCNFDRPSLRACSDEDVAERLVGHARRNTPTHLRLHDVIVFLTLSLFIPLLYFTRISDNGRLDRKLLVILLAVPGL